MKVLTACNWKKSVVNSVYAEKIALTEFTYEKRGVNGV